MNIKEIASLCGVSTATVSRVINGTAKVSPEVREKIEQILSETGYRPNALAKELLKNKTNVIGVLLPRIDLEIFAAAVEGITRVLNESGYNIILANTRESFEEEVKYMNLFKEKRVDGMIYFSTGFTEKHKELMDKLAFPIVIIGETCEGINFPKVSYDNFNAAKEMVKYLISMGHTKIGCIGTIDYDIGIGKMRKDGYKEAFKESGLPIREEYIAIGNYEFSSGYESIKAIMESNNEKPTALYAVTDRLAISAMHYLTEQGYKIPEDISVAGIDGLEIGRMYNPPLTTMNFDYMETGTSAAKILLECIINKRCDVKEIKINYEIKIRKSVKKIVQ